MNHIPTCCPKCGFTLLWPIDTTLEEVYPHGERGVKASNLDLNKTLIFYTTIANKWEGDALQVKCGVCNYLWEVHCSDHISTEDAPAPPPLATDTRFSL